MLNIGLRASAGMCDSVPSSLGSRGIIDDWSIDGEQTRVRIFQPPSSPCVHHVFGALAQLGVGGSLSRPRGDDVIRDDLMFRRAFQNTIQGSILVFQPPLPWMSSLGGSWNVCPSNPNPTRLLDTHQSHYSLSDCNKPTIEIGSICDTSLLPIEFILRNQFFGVIIILCLPRTS